MAPPKTKPTTPPEWMILPAEWGATEDYLAWADPWVPKDKLVIHFGGGENTAGSVTGIYAEQLADEKAVLRGWERFHIAPVSAGGRGWRGIAYSFAIGQSGEVYVLRFWNINGAHYNADDVDHDGISDNKESIAVVFILGGNQEPSAKAIAAFEKLRAYVEGTMEAGMPLYGHKEIGASGGHFTNCPGEKWLMPYVRSHRSSADSPPTTPPPVTPPPVTPPTPPTPEDDAMTFSRTTNPKAPQVKVFQLALQGWYIDSLPKFGADGTYGAETEAAVKGFQATLGLPPTGILEPVTQDFLAAFHPKSTANVLAITDKRYVRKP